MTEGIAQPTCDAAVVGAGIAGLACARAVLAVGRTPVVFERSRGVGGRCATRRIAGQPVDHGAAFLHGSDETFIAAIRGVGGATIVPGWPRRIEGVGPPCLPDAFEPLEHRLSYAEGLTAFPKQLARGLDLRLKTPVKALSEARGGVFVHTDAGRSFAQSVVLAVPPPAALRLLHPLLGDGRDAAAVGALLGMIGSQACLTVLAGYALDATGPSWDIGYPDDSSSVQMISHDSTKRAHPGFVVLVIQARPCWSYVHLEERDETWAPALIREAARVVGAWAERPVWTQAHRWRYARSDRGSALTRPLLLRVRGGGRVVVTGESFAPGGGIEAAWLAGNASVRRLFEEE